MGAVTAVAIAPFAAPSGDSAFIVELTSFSGPLDLLLALLREEQVDIYDIPIARIAEQFLARIRTLGADAGDGAPHPPGQRVDARR